MEIRNNESSPGFIKTDLCIKSGRCNGSFFHISYCKLYSLFIVVAIWGIPQFAHGQSSAGQSGICEFATLSNLNSFDPSSSNWACKLAYVQDTDLHYYWNGSAWVEMAGFNLYTQNGSLTGARTINLNGNDLTVDGTTDVVFKSDGDVGIGTSSPDAKLDVEGGSVRFSDYGSGTYEDTTAMYMLGIDADGDLMEMNTAKASRWFYAPSLTIDASSLVNNQTLNLYTEYLNQFKTPMYKSTGAPTEIPFYGSGDLYYYITYYDNTVMNIDDLSTTGVLQYDITSVPSNDYTQINVVFVIK